MTRCRRWIAAGMCFAYAPACTSYQALADPVPELQRYPSYVGPARVTLVSGARLEFDSLKVNGDSLRGFLKGGVQKGVALADVQAVQLRREDMEKTEALTVAVMCTILSVLGHPESCSSGDEE